MPSPTLVTRNWSSSRLRQMPGNWLADESFVVTGTAITTKAAAIAAVRAEHPLHWDNAGMKLSAEINAEAMSGAQAYKVSGVYGFRVPIPSDSPLGQPTVYRGGFETITVPTDYDINGNAIVNSAGDPFDPPPTREETVFVLVCERNIPFFSIAVGATFTGATNSNAFTLPGVGGVNRGQALCRVYQPVGDWSVGDDFVRVQAVIAFRTGIFPWDLHIKDQGRNSFHNTSGVKPGAICDPQTGEPVSIDVALDGTGKPIYTAWKVTSEKKAAVANGSTPAGLFVDTSRSSATAKILEWYITPEANFAALPF